MRKQTIKKGRHFTNWWQRYWWVYPNQSHQCRVRVGARFPYVFRKPDGDIDNSLQLDWNKLEGIAFNWLDPHDRTLMVGYRWNPFEKLIEANFYYHGITDGELDYATIGNGALSSRDFIRFERNEIIRIDRQLLGNDRILTIMTREGGDEILRDEVKIEYDPGKKHRRINNYFGGQGTAQHEFCVWKKYS